MVFKEIKVATAGSNSLVHYTKILIRGRYNVPSTKMISATELRPGAELESEYDETLVVSERDGDEITWEVDGDYTETFTTEEVQASLDDGVIKVVETGSKNESDGSGDGDNSHEPEEIADVDPSEVRDSDLYIRFGGIPENEQSYDNRNDRLEDGVSVYACENAETDEDAPDDVGEAYYLAGTMLQTVFSLMHRDTYLVTGEQVGTGADGEPVIQDVEVVANLTTPKGVGGWIVEGEN